MKIYALQVISDISHTDYEEGNDIKQVILLYYGAARILIDILGERSQEMVALALESITDISAGNDDQTLAIANAGFMSKMDQLLYHSTSAIRSNACVVLRNMVNDETYGLLDKVLYTHGVMPRVIELAMSPEIEVRTEEAFWFVRYVIKFGTEKHIMDIAKAGALDALCIFLDVDFADIDDYEIHQEALNAMEMILSISYDLGIVHDFETDCDTWDAMVGKKFAADILARLNLSSRIDWQEAARAASNDTTHEL